MMTGMFMLFNNDEYREHVEKIMGVLQELGLTMNEAKVYIYLAKTGYKKATEVAESVGIPRTETYQILNRLQSKGLVKATLEHPIRYVAIELNELLKTMINVGMERLKEFERSRDEIMRVWSALPEFAKTTCEDKDRFQILEGRENVYARMSSMINDATDEILIACNEVDALRLYNYGIIDLLAGSKASTKIISNIQTSMVSMFIDLGLKNVRHVKGKVPFMMIRDGKEMIYAIRNNSKNDTTVLWTDSQAIIEAMGMLFFLLWEKGDKDKDGIEP
jgi:sugar-specific transcriptional regulator TrmB